jgi:hypothetical protein
MLLSIVSLMKISAWKVGLFTGVSMILCSGLFHVTVLYFEGKKTFLISVDYTTEYTLCSCVTSCQLPRLLSFSSFSLVLSEVKPHLRPKLSQHMRCLVLFDISELLMDG